jgi:hypothetical protein
VATEDQMVMKDGFAGASMCTCIHFFYATMNLSSRESCGLLP